MDYSLQYIRNQSYIFIISGCVSGIHDRWIEVVFFKAHCCLMNMNKSPSPAPDIVIISLHMILENNGIAALMENQSPYISMYLIFFFSLLQHLFLPVNFLEDLAFKCSTYSIFNSYPAHEIKAIVQIFIVLCPLIGNTNCFVSFYC